MRAVTRQCHTCVYCSEIFSDEHQFNSHVKNHTDKTFFKCSICADSFSNKTHLDQHVCVSRKEFSHACVECDKTFRKKSSLTLHNQIKHGERQSLKCDYCLKSFIHKSRFEKHVRAHTEDKPYKCKLCSKSFAQSNSLKMHLRTHTREKYHCEKCDQSFFRENTFIKHFITHIDKSSYQCKQCGKSYTHQRYLTLHSKKCIGKHLNKLKRFSKNPQTREHPGQSQANEELPIQINNREEQNRSVVDHSGTDVARTDFMNIAKMTQPSTHLPSHLLNKTLFADGLMNNRNEASCVRLEEFANFKDYYQGNCNSLEQQQLFENVNSGTFATASASSSTYEYSINKEICVDSTLEQPVTLTYVNGTSENAWIIGVLDSSTKNNDFGFEKQDSPGLHMAIQKQYQAQSSFGSFNFHENTPSSLYSFDSSSDTSNDHVMEQEAPYSSEYCNSMPNIDDLQSNSSTSFKMEDFVKFNNKSVDNVFENNNFNTEINDHMQSAMDLEFLDSFLAEIEFPPTSATEDTDVIMEEIVIN